MPDRYEQERQVLRAEPGARVEIRRSDINELKKRRRKRPWYGYITSKDGYYIYVRPRWCKWEIELYPSELKLAPLPNT